MSLRLTPCVRIFGKPDDSPHPCMYLYLSWLQRQEKYKMLCLPHPHSFLKQIYSSSPKGDRGVRRAMIPALHNSTPVPLLVVPGESPGLLGSAVRHSDLYHVRCKHAVHLRRKSQPE
jgi:hypothetical protein